jgi:hypothetical protein
VTEPLEAKARLMPAASTVGVKPEYAGMVYVTVEPPGSRLLDGQAAEATVTTGGGGGGNGDGGGDGLGGGDGSGGGGEAAGARSRAVLMHGEAHKAPAGDVVICG